MTTAKFPLGQTVMTPGVQEMVFAGEVNPAKLLERHASGDWGDLGSEDKATNEAALRLGDRLLSFYDGVVSGTEVWVITEADRSVTTLLLPEEY